MVAFCFYPTSCLASPTPSPTSHKWIPQKVLTSASRCFSAFHCCSARIMECAGSVFRSSCFSRVTAASYSSSVKSLGRNSPGSPLPFFFPVTYEGRKWQGQKKQSLPWVHSPQRMLQEAPDPPSLLTATSLQHTTRPQAAAQAHQDCLKVLVVLSS